MTCHSGSYHAVTTSGRALGDPVYQNQPDAPAKRSGMTISGRISAAKCYSSPLVGYSSGGAGSSACSAPKGGAPLLGLLRTTMTEA